MLETLIPDWSAPAHVKGLQTCRSGGVSGAPWDSLNLGNHVGDAASNVLENRARIGRLLPQSPSWLSQVHGTTVVDAAFAGADCEADAMLARAPGQVCVVMTADCLPVLLTDCAGSVVAAAHAGWRGLAAGVLETTIGAMAVSPGEVLAWLGPAIGPDAFEVGEEVRQEFLARDPATQAAFRPGVGGKWLADIYELARFRLRTAGVKSISGGEFCTFRDANRFFSYRRDGVTGRMASMIWIDRNTGV